MSPTPAIPSRRPRAFLLVLCVHSLNWAERLCTALSRFIYECPFVALASYTVCYVNSEVFPLHQFISVPCEKVRDAPATNDCCRPTVGLRLCFVTHVSDDDEISLPAACSSCVTHFYLGTPLRSFYFQRVWTTPWRGTLWCKGQAGRRFTYCFFLSLLVVIQTKFYRKFVRIISIERSTATNQGTLYSHKCFRYRCNPPDRTPVFVLRLERT